MFALKIKFALRIQYKENIIFKRFMQDFLFFKPMPAGLMLFIYFQGQDSVLNESFHASQAGFDKLSISILPQHCMRTDTT